MKKEKLIIIMSLYIALILVITSGLTYSYFAINIKTNEITTIYGSTGNMLIEYNGGPNIVVGNLIPKGDAFTSKTFTVTGTSAVSGEMKYNISLVKTKNNFRSYSLSYELSSTNTDSNGTEVPSRTMCYMKTGEGAEVLGTGTFIGPTNGNKTHTYTLSLYFTDTETENFSKEFNFYVSIEEGPKTASTCTSTIPLINQTKEGQALEFQNTVAGLASYEITAEKVQNPPPAPTNPASMGRLQNITLVSSNTRRNLLLNSEKLSTTGSNAAGLSRSVSQNGDLVITSLSGNGNWVSNFGLYASDPNVRANVKSGDILTFSIKMRSNDSTSKPVFYFGPGMGYYTLTGTMSENWSTFYYTGPWVTTAFEPHLGFGSAIGTFELKEAKLELGSTVTSWAPNPESVPEGVTTNGIFKTTINLPNELYYLDGAYDRLFKDTDGVWKISKKTGEYTFTGSENWTLEQRHTTDAMVQAYTPTGAWSVTKKVTSSTYGKSNRFFDIRNESTVDKTGSMGISAHNGYNVMRLKFPPTMVSLTMSNSNTEIINALKTWLTNNQTKVAYERDVYTTITLNQTLQNKLNSLPTFKINTYLYSTGTENPVINATLKTRE